MLEVFPLVKIAGRWIKPIPSHTSSLLYKPCRVLFARLFKMSSFNFKGKCP
jgi:hypothetical protein